MEKAIHKKILIYSLIAAIISVVLTGIFLLMKKFIYYEVIAVTGIIFIYVLISVITSYVIVYQERKWIKEAARYTFFFFPVLLTLMVLGVVNLDSSLLVILLYVSIALITILSLLHIFVFSDAVSLKWTIIFIVIIILTIIMKRFHLPFSGFILTLASMLFALGIYIYGIRCIYLSEKFPFLKYVSFFGGLIIAVTFTGLLFKLMHWPGGDLYIIISHILLLIGTIIGLLTLPSSGIIEWEPIHKGIMRRIIIPWVFIFTLFIIRYLLPELDGMIWRPQSSDVPPFGFEMYDYPIENRNGLK